MLFFHSNRGRGVLCEANLSTIACGSFQFNSVAQSCPTLWDPMDHSTPGIPVHHQLLEFTKTHVHKSVMLSNHLILCHPLFLLPSIFHNIRGLFEWVSSSHQVTKVLEFQLQHSPSNEHSGLISFRMGWLDLLAVQGTLKSLLQHQVQKHQFFGAQLSLESKSHIHT